MNILIAEDDGIIALELERIVRDAGHNVIGPVSTLEQALAYAMKADAALIDLGLSDGDSGSQLGRRLIDRLGIKVIFVTGSPSSVGHGLDGSVDVVSKPFTDERILAALSKAGSRAGAILVTAQSE